MGKLIAQLGDLFGDLKSPARVLIVALVGLWFAQMLLGRQWLCATGWLLVVIAIAYAVEWIGFVLLPRHPRAGLFFLEWWVLAPAAVAAFALGDSSRARFASGAEL